MTPLSETLKSRIKSEGPLSVAEYMQECLYNPEHGYYMKSDVIGRAGDFTTAPEITQIFGEILGAWVADTWIKMGKPKQWSLIELGPGRGTLMEDMMRTLQAACPEAYEGMHVTLVEISPSLKHFQRERLENHRVMWANSVEDVDFSNPSIIIANEFLDAFPTRQFVRQNDTYVERMVDIKEDKFTFTTAKHTYTPDTETNAPIIELQDAMESYLCKIKDKMKNGVALFIDYGDEGYGDSFQAIQNHQKVDVLEYQGEADLTTHVNFNNIRKIFGAQKTSQMEYMGTFLTSLGFAMRAAHLLEISQTDARKKSIEQAAHRLLHPEQMGELFKVMAYQTGEWPLAGLAFMQQTSSQTAA